MKTNLNDKPYKVKYRVEKDLYREEYNYNNIYILTKVSTANSSNTELKKYAGRMHDQEKAVSYSVTFDEIIEYAFKYMESKGGTRKTIDKFDEVANQPDFVILKPEGKPCYDETKLTKLISESEEGDLVKMGYIRAKREVTNNLTNLLFKSTKDK